jgi:hypothetical protein
MTRPVSLGLLPSGPDPVGEGYVHRQPPGCYIVHLGVDDKCPMMRENRLASERGGGYKDRRNAMRRTSHARDRF